MFSDIKAKALSVMTHYQNDLDLDEIDINNNPGTPYLHFVRKTGTLLVMLPPTDKFPKIGEFVPHLFSGISRDGMLKNIIDMSAYYNNDSNGPCELVHYFDGEKIHKSSPKKAAEIGLAHARKIEAEWRKQREKHYTYA